MDEALAFSDSGALEAWPTGTEEEAVAVDLEKEPDDEAEAVAKLPVEKAEEEDDEAVADDEDSPG